jgi:hypothetical protein
MQEINEVPLEEEEGESQDITSHQRKLHQQQFSNQMQDGEDYHEAHDLAD